VLNFDLSSSLNQAAQLERHKRLQHDFFVSCYSYRGRCSRVHSRESGVLAMFRHGQGLDNPEETCSGKDVTDFAPES
jgi:hypothetical protein